MSCVHAIREPYAGWRDASPGPADRYVPVPGTSPLTGSSIPPCTSQLDESVTANLCSTLICGTQLHKFPAYESAGSASDANDVGEFGEKKIPSCPTTTDVLSQSIRMVAVRSRIRPDSIPFGCSGNPPARSSDKSARVRAPATRGPNTSKPSCDCRSVAPKLPPESPGSRP